MDEHVLPAFILLNESEAFVRVEKFDRTLALADDLSGHAAAVTATAAWPAWSASAAAKTAACAAAGRTAIAAEAAAAWCPEAITASEAVTASCEWIETVLSKTVPLVPALAATSSVETHKSERAFASPKC